MCISFTLNFVNNCINVYLFLRTYQHKKGNLPPPYTEVDIAYSMDDCKIQFVNNSLYMQDNDIHKTFTCDINSFQHSFLMFYCNMRSLTKNHERLEQMSALFPCTPHLITISETKLNANSDQKCITLPHYSFCHSPSDTIAEGVGVYISDSLEYRLRDDLKFIEEENENIWIEIMGNNSILNQNPRCLTNIIIGVIYRCPSCPIKNFISNFQPTLQYLQNISSPFYITGDINIDLLS